MAIRLVCTVSEYTDVPAEMVFPQPIRIQVDYVALCRGLWAELHSEQESTPEWFERWCKRVPSFGCNCRKWLREYLVTNPPRYDDWPAFANELHLAVSCKLDKPGWSVRTYDSIPVGV